MPTENKEKLDELIEIGLPEGSCVLFVGPELIKFNGMDYNLAFYNTLPENDEKEIDKKKVKYNADEKIWSFSSSSVKTKFYIKLSQFLKQNNASTNPIFHKIASLPIPLIISLIPDETLNNVFAQYSNLKFLQKSVYDSNIPEPSNDNILIYNIYGNLKDRNYVISHFDYLNFNLSAS